MPKKRNTITQNPNNELTTPRRSPRFLRLHNHTVSTTRNPPSNSKSPKPKHTTSESCSAIAARKSPRFANQSEEKPSKHEKSSSGSRRPAWSKDRDGCGPLEEEKEVNAKARKKQCVVSREEAPVGVKEENGEVNEGAEKPKWKRKCHGGSGCKEITVEEGWTKEQELAQQKAYLCVVSREEAPVGVKEGNREVNEGAEKPKRKRKRHGRSSGKEIAVEERWTKEQELALQKAYLFTKPSPNFWKNVSKLVRGKSQQDCFDKIHGYHITPPQPQPQSRANTIKSTIQPFSISASKLLKPIDKKFKRSNVLKPKNCITQKSVEKLLQRRLHVNQDREGDIFSVLEPNIDFHTNDFKPSVELSTPKQLKENQGLLQSETSSSSIHKKSLSRFSGSRITNLVSPPVLKQVKNKGLHEKYINQLRCRESKRRADSTRMQMPATGKVVGGGSNIQITDVVKAAKVALVSEARDAIKKFQESQVMDNTCSDEYNSDDIGVEDEC